MGLKQKALALLLLPLALTGCTSVVTNLTPRQYTRNTDGLYHFEMQWDTRQQSVIEESLKPFVLIGTEFFPMEPVAIVANRWETLVPIPADQKLVHYKFKVNYQYYAVPVRTEGSFLSPSYSLEVLDKK
jgi:hypothetical protein